MKRAYNFNAGPSAMPLEVLLEAQEEFLNYKNTGMSIIEMSHRSNEYAALHAETKQLLRELKSPKITRLCSSRAAAALSF